MKRDRTSALRALLEEERRDLLTGNLSALAGLAARKERMLDALHGNDAGDPAAWKKLHRAARRNEQLLASAIAGVRAAETRIGTARSAASQLDTYGNDGRRRALGHPASQHERKA